MKRTLTRAVAGLALAVAALAGPTATAHAHQFDDYSLWSCAWGRDNGSQVVVHSYPDQLGDGWVRYHCRARQYHAGVLVADVHYWVFWDQPSTLTKPWPSRSCLDPSEVCQQYPW